MYDAKWIFALALVTFALVAAFILISMYRTRRDMKNHVKTSLSREEIANKHSNVGDKIGL